MAKVKNLFIKYCKISLPSGHLLLLKIIHNATDCWCGLPWLVCAHCWWCSGLCHGWLTGCHGLYWVWLLFSKNKGMVFAMGGCRGLYWVWLFFSKKFCCGCFTSGACVYTLQLLFSKIFCRGCFTDGACVYTLQQV